MDSSLESFFHKNIIYPNDVKRRLNAIRVLDQKLSTKKNQLDELKSKIKSLKSAGSYGESKEDYLLNCLEVLYTEMKALSQEKYDLADTAFKMYENVLRKTDTLMDELKPEEISAKEIFPPKIKGVPVVGFPNIDMEEEKPLKPGRSRNKSKKKVSTFQKLEGIGDKMKKLDIAPDDGNQDVGDQYEGYVKWITSVL